MASRSSLWMAAALPVLLCVPGRGVAAPNLAAASAGALVSGPQNASGSKGNPPAATDGEVTDYGRSHGYSWGWLSEPLVVTFAEQSRINKVEVLLLDVDARRYDFRLEANVGGEWRALGEREAAKAWVTLTFEPVECEAVRLVFTRGVIATESYHVVEVAAYNDPEPERDSELKEAWGAVGEERWLADLRLLGIDDALERVFLDEGLFRRAKGLTEGERRWLDTDGDGDPDLIVLKDEGVIVCVIDDDDDATVADPEPDTDSDCWVADIDADGRPDRVQDYWDDDGDGDVDRAHHYYLHVGWFGARPGLILIWDYNDNNETWTLVRYSYNQGKCQWECDFGGNEGFSIFIHDQPLGEWSAHWECPFYFYDPDDDGLAEVAVRLEGHGLNMRALRYSMNADNDSTDQPYDYDFGITALGPVDLPEDALVREGLRSGETGLFLPYETARAVCRQQPWTQACLVWDENDENIDPADGASHERWEGVINARYGEFPQVGGPSCGTVNKRYELDVDNSGGLKLYASPVDGRLHLLGAEEGTLWADDDGDRRPDRIVAYRDADGDGFFDEWQYDDDADGEPERTVRPGRAYQEGEPLPLDWERVTAIYRPLLAGAVEGHEQVAAALGIDLTADELRGSLESRRWALERRIHQAFHARLAAGTAHDAARASATNRALQYWERGQYRAAERAIGAPDDGVR